jgi:hypothetical protein
LGVTPTAAALPVFVTVSQTVSHWPAMARVALAAAAGLSRAGATATVPAVVMTDNAWAAHAEPVTVTVNT